MIENILSIFRKALRDLYKNPIIIIPSLILFIFFIVFSWVSVKINYVLQTTLMLSLWFGIFILLSLFVISFFLSGLIGMSLEIVRKKLKLYHLWKYSRNFWFKNFLIILIILIAYNIIWLLSHNATLLIGRVFNLPLNFAQILYFLFYFSGLAGIIIFLTYSSFFLIIFDLGVFDSVKKSVFLVRKKYIETLCILVIFFAISGVLSLVDNKIFIEVINAVFLVPYLSLILTRMVLSFDFLERK